jgi:hydrogenase-4 component B
LNGFVSEWLMYLSLLSWGLANHGGGNLIALFAVGVLALVGGLAAITFVRLTGVVLLGSPRSEAARHAHESSRWMLGPMWLLVACCVIVAVAPHTVVGLMSGALDQTLGLQAGIAPTTLKSSEAPLSVLGSFNAVTLTAVVGGTLALLAWIRRTSKAEGVTWGCGYVMPTVRMQYTGRSFAEMMAEHLLPRFLMPRTRRQGPRGIFPSAGDFAAECPDPVSQRMYEPFFRRCGERFSGLRILQQGKVNIYLVYIVLTVVLALAWVSIRTMWAPS